MVDQPHCDVCGSPGWTGEDAARIVMGALVPAQTGYLCPQCVAGVKAAAQTLADEIDQAVYEQVFRKLSD